MKTTYQKIIYISISVVLFTLSSCGTKKGGCGLTGDIQKPLSTTEKIVYS